MKLFGPAWSKRLCLGSAKLSSLGHPVTIESILTVIWFESAGTFDPNVLQGRAKLVKSTGPKDKRSEVAGHFGLRLSHGSGARGLFQVMPVRAKRTGQVDLITLYSIDDPIEQLNEGIERFYNASIGNKFGGYKTREALYCANLAPARLVNGNYNDDTILYTRDVKYKGQKCYYPPGYIMNAEPFGLDPDDPEGALRMKHLSIPLDQVYKSDRYNAEVEAAYIINANS